MLNYKNILSIFFLVISLSSCMEQKVLFNFYTDTDNNPDTDKDKKINPNVFKEIPGLGSSTYLKFPVSKKASKMEVYISSFREKYIEKDHLLEFTELNDDSKISSADYRSVEGYSQDLYILKYEFTYAVTRREKTLEVTTEAAVFFSVKYNGRGDTIGVTPCYFGIINTEDNVIAFDTKLSLKKEGNNYYLKLHKKKKNLNGLLFMPANFPAHPSKSKTKLNIEKVVKLDPGKIGGYKPLVFDIAKIFHDPTALQFHYETTLLLKP